MYKINVSRGKLPFDFFRSYSIHAANQQKNLKFNQKVSFTSDSRQLNLETKIDWCKSSFSQVITGEGIDLMVYTNPIFSGSALLSVIFFTLSVFFGEQVLELIAAGFGLVLLSGITLFKNKYLLIRELK